MRPARPANSAGFSHGFYADLGKDRLPLLGTLLALGAPTWLPLNAAAAADNCDTVRHNDAQRGVTPVNQTLKPLERQIELTGVRPQALALSPDGSRLL
jgi:hypothetical protein